MADVAALALSVDSSQVTQATVALKELPKAATAAERAADRWSASTRNATRDSDEFSKRVQRVIKDLSFEREQLARSADERQRYAALRRAGVAAASQEGQAILASVRALQAQRDALGQASVASRAYSAVWTQIKGLLAGLSIAAAASALVNFARSAFEAASGLQEAAEQIGVTAENLQALQFQATQNGVKLEQLDTGLSKFSQKMGEAAEGSKEMVEALTKLGVKNLDVQGKLRPTEDLLVDVAKAITSIDDPARRSAAAVDFFGKAGTRMLPLLTEIAKGTDAWTDSARRAGAIIGDETIGKLDALADKMAQNRLVFQAGMAESLATLDDWRNAFNSWARDVGMSVENGFESVRETVGKWMDDTAAQIAGGIAGLVEGFASMPEMIGTFFTNAWESARVATAKGINWITELVDKLPTWLGGGHGSAGLDTTPRSAGSVGAGVEERMRAERDRVESEFRTRAAAAEQQRELEKAQNAAALLVSGSFGGAPGSARTSTTGAGTSAAKGAGKEAENAAKKYAELIAQLTLAADAQDKMTAAAARGEVAFQQQEIEVKAAEKALSIFGQVLDKTDPRLRKIVDLMTRESQGKIAQAFSLATNELEDQNVILQKQLDLMGQSPELIAKEIAMLKVKQDVERAGVAITQEEIDRRTQVVETNERLKAQGEELRRANELWTAPLKSALESIQQTAADAFDSMLENGKLSFESLAQTFTKILRRMAAEFLALATVRPVMSVIVNAIGGQGMASQFGLGGSTGGGFLGGLGNLFSGSGGGGFLSGIGNWLGSTIGGGLPSGQFGPPAPGQGFSSGFLGDITWGQGLGALAGAGMGIFQLMNSRSTASTIGGISSILGAGVSLIPGIGQFLGPAIGLLGNLIPGLFGQTKPTITDQTYAQLRYSSGGWFTNGGAWGPSANSSQSEQSILGLGKNLDAVFALLGGVVDPQKVWGLSAQNRTDSGPDWSSSSLSSFLVSPSGNQQLWRMNDDTMWDTGSAQVAWRSIVEGAVGEISENMRNALTKVGQDPGGGMGLQAIAETIAQVKAFDDAVAGLGKTTTGVEAALMQIDAQFASLYDVATQFGFAVEQIDTAKLKARLEFATSFADSLQRGINDLTDPKINALADLDKWRDEAIKTNADILKNVTGSLDQINKIEELYGLQRAQILADTNEQIIDAQKQAGEAQIATLQDLIRSLSPGGALANVDPRSQLAGLEATYNATRSQARSGDQAAIDRFASDASAYAQFAKSFYGGSTDYNRIRDRIIGDATSLQMSIGAGWSSTPTASNANDAAMRTVTSQFSQLMATVQSLTEQLRQSEERTARLEALLQRFVANEKAPQAAA